MVVGAQLEPDRGFESLALGTAEADGTALALPVH